MIFFGFFGNKKKDRESNKKNLSPEEWPDYAVTLNEKNFHEFIQKYPLSVVDFWAPWCGPCKAMIPRLRRLSKIYKGRVAFGRLNTQENKDIAKQYKIMGIPHLAFFSYGKKITSTTGLKSVGEIKDMIDARLEKNK